MVELAGIYTIRDTPHPHYWDVVYEWEDELSNALNIPLVTVGTEYDLVYRPSVVRKALNRLDYYKRIDQYLFHPTKFYVAFHIGPPGVYSFHNRKNVIPIIIDFWKSENLKKFESRFSLNKVVFVTSREVYNYLVDQKIKINIDHLALSLPDKIFFNSHTEIREFDLIQIGRQNERINTYVKLLLQEGHKVNYVYADKINGKIEMFSTTKGKLGGLNNRESFLNLLRKTKISLLSAPGLDDDAKRTGGFSPVTPRFLESAACGCHLIGVYPENADFAFYGISEICPNVNDYESFKNLVLKYLNDPRRPDNRKFLQRHLTSERATELKSKISSSHANR